MKEVELQALKGSVSNDARVLYILGLRPNANHTTGVTEKLNYKSLTALLNSTETKYTRGRQLNELILELQQSGLVSFVNDVSMEQSFNKQPLLLPLLILPTSDYQNIHHDKQSMSTNWQPNDDLYDDLALLVGIVEKEYYKDELGDFIAYWMGRPEVLHTSFQWTQRFVQHIKKNRIAVGYKPAKQLATQTIQKKAELVTDDNTKKLVEKYSGKHQR